MNEATPVGGLLDLISLWHNGTIADAMALVDAVKRKDVPAIRAAVVKIAGDIGYGADAKEIDDVVDGVLKANWAAVVYQAGDAAMKFAVNHMGYVVPSAEAIKLMAVTPASEMTNAEAKKWLADNRASARSGGKHIVGRFILRRAPEVLTLLRGESTTAELAAIDPERLAKIIDIMRVAIPILTVAGAAFPPLLVVSTVLRLIVSFYDSKHPTTATVASAEGDKGLSLADLL